MHAVFATIVLYGQLAVSSPAGPPPALVWTDAEVAQGFAWDRDLVAFGVPDHDGDVLVEVDTDWQAPFELAPDALWAVAVPFTAAAPSVEIGTVLLERTFPIRPGRYQLVFQARPGGPDHAYRLEVAFARDGPSGYAILKQGSLGTDRVLSTQARRG